MTYAVVTLNLFTAKIILVYSDPSFLMGDTDQVNAMITFDVTGNAD